ncbi:16S rRNA (guanine(966)-N(2))-methyltransferase RsmD [Staphylococcus americanisciuri]|uniref:16S rRNA (Guanine(966)-N(2))-methyltransferase RsmD n=1 Tax=Staphylococcus americanisciuri TaxID=2973940 RepID=A0ABT2F3G2_9STAP|nr:16S rRNA (guanine(966)-N(2))-methyltransferase RsmD [Staphylococcus americanisciuri]MCS4486748.1 16S rRNA (guanine(966)-N(2))-methyltransferase RsmD [Staphylococcus americanisciuri]
MRVIAGKHKSKTLETLEGRNTRPTMDKVKEGIFNSLQHIEGLGLDLFAGSGSLGIEALSRGMDKVIFVDQNSRAIKVIHQNLQRLGLDTQAEVYRNNADRALKALSKREIQFDIIFLDPPYDKGLIDKALEQIHAFDLLKNNGMIVCEFSHREVIQTAPFEEMKRYHYGLTDTCILRKGESHG